MTGAFLTCVDKKMDGSVHVKHHKNSLMSPHYSNLANSLMSAFRDEVRVKLDNTIHEEHEIHANVSATFMKKCLAEQKIDMSMNIFARLRWQILTFFIFCSSDADLLCKVDDYVHNISSSEAPPARDISCYYMCEYQFIGLVSYYEKRSYNYYFKMRNNKKKIDFSTIYRWKMDIWCGRKSTRCIETIPRIASTSTSTNCKSQSTSALEWVSIFY